MPICSSEKLRCVENVTIDNSDCKPMCEGLIVTSYSRSENQRNLEKYISIVGKDYDNYKTFVKYPASIKGKCINIKYRKDSVLQITNGKTNCVWCASTLTPRHSIGSLRTDPQNLWTCSQQLEELWDFSLASQL